MIYFLHYIKSNYHSTFSFKDSEFQYVSLNASLASETFSNIMCKQIYTCLH